MTVLPVNPATPMPSPFRPEQGDTTLTSDLMLAALPSAVSTARRFTTLQLGEWGLAHLAEAAELVVSEIVTNAVRHTGTLVPPTGYADLHARTPATIVLRLRVAAGHLFTEVWDRSERPPQPAHPGDTDETGRGLLLVAACATGWSWYPSQQQPGKVVHAWFTLPPERRPTRPEPRP